MLYTRGRTRFIPIGHYGRFEGHSVEVIVGVEAVIRQKLGTDERLLRKVAKRIVAAQKAGSSEE